jgi:hypothetical protein
MDTLTLSTALVMTMILALAIYFRLQLTAMERRLSSLRRIDAKLDLVLGKLDLTYGSYGDLPSDIVDALEAGDRIRAVALYRATKGCSLKEAKDWINATERRKQDGTLSARELVDR